VERVFYDGGFAGDWVAILAYEVFQELDAVSIAFL
jgi:hypothetical protein